MEECPVLRMYGQIEGRHIDTALIDGRDPARLHCADLSYYWRTNDVARHVLESNDITAFVPPRGFLLNEGLCSTWKRQQACCTYTRSVIDTCAQDQIE